MNIMIFRNNNVYLNDIWLCNYLDSNKLTTGIYNLEINYSPKFKTKLPLIYNSEFPANRGFRIHQGNSISDSNGCLLVGILDKPGHLVDSKKTLDILLKIIINNNVNTIVIMR